MDGFANSAPPMGGGFSNTHPFWCGMGFNAVLIEANPESYSKLLENTTGYKNVLTFNKFVNPDPEHPDSLNSILLDTPIVASDDNLQLLSVDVDGPDFDILKWFGDGIGLNNFYKPKIVIAECNSSFGKFQHKITSDQGTSAAAMVAMMKSKSYELCAYVGNAIFCRNDLFPLLGISDNSLTELWDY